MAQYPKMFLGRFYDKAIFIRLFMHYSKQIIFKCLHTTKEITFYFNQELVIEDQGRDCAEALVRMKNLESLTLENYSWHHNDER